MQPVFAIGAIIQHNVESMQAEIGCMLVCDSRDTPMGDEEIEFIASLSWTHVEFAKWSAIIGTKRRIRIQLK